MRCENDTGKRENSIYSASETKLPYCFLLRLLHELSNDSLLPPRQPGRVLIPSIVNGGPTLSRYLQISTMPMKHASFCYRRNLEA